jgi:NDP-4-keto-2,6-dideoxyhexose 3-C-methyltransferase
LNTLAPFHEFAKRTEKSRGDLQNFVREANAQGKTVAALGASTKGNVLLQYCGFTKNEIKFVGEVNEEKYGCFTPGTWLPIISETELLSKNIDYLIVLPWHFRKFFQGQAKYKNSSLVFPLPVLEVIKKNG